MKQVVLHSLRRRGTKPEERRRRTHGSGHLSIIVVVGLILTLVLGSAQMATARPLADAPVVFASEAGLINTLALKDGTVFWGSPCSNEILPPTTFVRSKPGGDGPIRTLFERDAGCLTTSVQSNLAVDEAYVYWIDAQDRLVRQRRSATAGDTPALVVTLPAGTGRDVAVDGSYVYWLEMQSLPLGGGHIMRLPKAGGSPLSGTIPDPIAWSLKVDSAGNVYYLVGLSGNASYTLVRATAGAGGFSTMFIGTHSQVRTYTLDNGRAYWIENVSGGSDQLVRSAPLANPSAVTTHYTIPGSGSPKASFLTVDAANLYWVQTYPDCSEDIVRLPLASPTPAVVAGYPAGGCAVYNLVSSGRYLFWTYWGYVYRLPVTATLPDLTAQDLGLEVVQVIQGSSNDVPLTTGKETFVRLYGRLVPDNPGLTSVLVSPSAALYGVRNGSPLLGSPLRPISNSAQITAQVPDRRNLQNSVLFQLPLDWTEGTVTLQGYLNPMHAVPESSRANNMASAIVTFQNVPSYCLYMVPVETTSGTLTGPSPFLSQFIDRAVSAWPLAHFDVGFDGGPAQRRPKIPFGIGGSDPYRLDSDFEMGYLLWNLWWTYNVNTGYACNGAGTAIVAAVPSASRDGMEGSGVLFFLAQQGATAGSNSEGLSLAHELGHALGRQHVNCYAPGDEPPADPDNNYPYPVCQTDFDNSAAHVGLDSLTRTLFPPASTADYMSYSLGTLWTSDYTYRALLQQLKGGANVTSLRNAASGDKLLVGGMLGSAPMIGYAFGVSSAQAAEIANKLNASTLPSLDYQLRTYDAAGNLIASTPLRVAQLQTEGGADMPVFFNLVDAAPAPARLEVRRVGGPVVAARTAGPNPPSLSISAPASGATVGARLDIAWTASDPDGDPLLFTVRYSPDNGATWQMLGNQISERSLSVATAGLPGGSQALVEVIASDGVHSTSAIAGPFAVTRHAPQVAILDSAYRQISGSFPAAILQSDATDLRAQAYDPEDGMLSGAALHWSMTGPVNRTGTGEKLRLEGLAPGTYQVTVSATDSDGRSAQAGAALTVSPKRVFDTSTGPRLDGYCDDPAYGADQDPIAIRYDDGSMAEARLARVGSALYACLAGLPRGGWTSSSAALQFDLNDSGDPLAMPDDLIFSLTEDGVASTSVGNGQGGFSADSVPQGLAAAVSHSDTSWNAEFRIDTIRLGGWNKLVRMRVGHYWRNFPGDDVAWPVNEGWNSPASWGLTALGELTQTITFAALPDRLVSDPPFALLASTSSGLPPTYTVQGACTILGHIVTLTGPGRCTITASQPGNASYAPASPVTRSFTIRTRVFLPLIVK